LNKPHPSLINHSDVFNAASDKTALFLKSQYLKQVNYRSRILSAAPKSFEKDSFLFTTFPTEQTVACFYNSMQIKLQYPSEGALNPI